MIRYGRLRERERLRRFGKPAMFRDRMKRPQLRVLHVCLAINKFLRYRHQLY
jgi:hypothetical protein